MGLAGRLHDDQKLVDLAVAQTRRGGRGGRLGRGFFDELTALRQVAFHDGEHQSLKGPDVGRKKIAVAEVVLGGGGETKHRSRVGNGLGAGSSQAQGRCRQGPSRPVGQPLNYEGAFLMRAGEGLVPMTSDYLRRTFAEGQPDWFVQPAKADASADEVIALLDTQTYFELLTMLYPSTRDAVLARLQSEGLIAFSSAGWTVSNMAAILLAKRLDAFSPALARMAARVVVYDGTNKLITKDDKPGLRGYAVGFGSLVDFVHSAAPQNRFVEQAVREEVKMFPKQALRELIANALVHQDFLASGASVMIELYADRVEISNPGLPPIKVERFIDEYRSHNERLADLMRRLGICEEKGSGIDKVIRAAEVFQLPAPDFRAGELRTTALLFAHQEFANMSKGDRVRACYQHCCLMYMTNQRMSNQSLRLRFGLGEDKTLLTSQVIGAAKEAGLTKADESETTSTWYARYLSFWA